MARPTKNKLKRFGIDALGVILIICAGLFGWIPGPGGIPLLLAGLGLLSINHRWARRWLVKMRDSGNRVSEVIFPEHWLAKLVYDLLTVAGIIAAVYIFNNYTHNLLRSAAIVLVAVSLSIFLFNRKRLAKISAFFSSKH